jgi:hypothetical protein
MKLLTVVDLGNLLDLARFNWLHWSKSERNYE